MNRYVIIMVIFLMCLLSSETSAQEIAAEQAKAAAEQKKDIEAALPVIEIKQVKPGEPIYSFELRDAQIKDLMRILAYDYKLNILVDKNVKGKITASLTNISLDEALERIADMYNLTLEKKGNVIIVKPNLITKVFILKNLEAKELLKFPQEAGKEGKKEAGGGFRASTVYDLLSEEGKILLGEQQNSIVVIDFPSNVKRIEEFLQVADQKMATAVFKLKYLSVKEISPELIEIEREERKKQREERKEERNEIKELKEKAEEGGK